MKERQTLVVGGTGLLGAEIVRLLREAGKPVKVMVRTTSDPEKIAQLELRGAEVVRGDLKDRESLVNACQGIDTVVSTATATMSRQPGDSVASVDHQGQLDLIDAADQCGVKQFVFISFAPIQVDCALQRAKRVVEARLLQGKMAFTVLQPIDFMEVWLSPALGFDPIKGPASVLGNGLQPVNWISLLDVARFAVSATENRALQGKVLPLGGPDALSPLQVLKIFEELGAPKVKVEFISEKDLEEQLEKAADAVQEAFAAIMLSTARGYAANPRDAVEVLPGRLRSVREYAAEVIRQSKQNKKGG
jgi:uncharacterized protein YbjT (DUF2867 family)